MHVRWSNHPTFPKLLQKCFLKIENLAMNKKDKILHDKWWIKSGQKTNDGTDDVYYSPRYRRVLKKTERRQRIKKSAVSGGNFDVYFCSLCIENGSEPFHVRRRTANGKIYSATSLRKELHCQHSLKTKTKREQKICHLLHSNACVMLPTAQKLFFSFFAFTFLCNLDMAQILNGHSWA